MREVPGLDWLRGIAASLVLLSHAKSFFFVNYPDYTGPRDLYVQAFYLISGLGTSSVIIFFVLSGYLVAGSMERSWYRQQWSFSRYLVARLSRLWTVLLPCLLLTIGLDWIGIAAFDSPFYEGTLSTELSSGPKEPSDWSLTTIIGNTFFLQTIFVPVLGSNGPLWSISNEFWYYMLFPFLFLTFVTPVGRIKHMLIFCLITYLAGWDIVRLFPLWLAGFGVWHFRSSNPARLLRQNAAMAFIAVMLLVIGILLLRVLQVQHTMSGYYIAGLLTSIAIPALHHGMFQVGVSLAHWASRLSYSLYLVHFPVLALLASAYGNIQATTLAEGMPIFLAGILASFLSAGAVWFLFERHTPKLRFRAEAVLFTPRRGSEGPK